MGLAAYVIFAKGEIQMPTLYEIHMAKRRMGTTPFSFHIKERFFVWLSVFVMAFCCGDRPAALAPPVRLMRGHITL